jgi:hypothetical protein
MGMIFINVFGIFISKLNGFWGLYHDPNVGGQFGLVEQFAFVDLSLNLMMNKIQLFLICILLVNIFL